MMIDDIGPLETAGLGEITVFCDARYLDKFLSTRASATVTNHDLASLGPNRSGLLFVEHPRLAYAQIAHLFYPASPPVSGVDAIASIDPTPVIVDQSQMETR